MEMLTERFIVDRQGRRVAVVLGMEEYAQILERLEDQEDAQAVREALASGEKGIPLEQAFAELDKLPE